MTVRRRLFLGIVASLVVLIAAIGGAEVVALRHLLYARTAQGLRNEVRLLSSASLSSASSAASPPLPLGSAAPGTSSPTSCPELAPGAPPLVPGPPGGPGHGHAEGHALGPEGAQGLAQALTAKGIASAVVSPTGDVVACAGAGRGPHTSGFGVPDAALARLSAAGGPGTYVTLDSLGHHLLAISEPLGPGGGAAVLVTDLGDDDAAVTTVLLVTVLGGLAALLLSGGLTLPLLRSGLAPLRRMAQTADAIAAGSLDRRAGLGQSRDEVGRLGLAFDRMVDRLQGALGERDALVGRLRGQEQAMRQFLADASHELRTPLTAIRGGAQVLALGGKHDPDQLDEALGHIQAQAERMSRLVDDLLLLSRRDGGGLELEHETVNLADLVLVERAHWEALTRPHPLQVVAQPAWVRGDRDALTRAATNLVENAAKYSPPISPIKVGVASGPGWAELTVADRGPGIPPQDRKRVFERFYRGDPARSRASGGSGLGLAIVAGIVADHGGVARVEEVPGGGALLIVRLPLAPAPTGGGTGPEEPSRGEAWHDGRSGPLPDARHRAPGQRT